MARPRVTESLAGTVVGALIGGLLGGPAGSAVLGAGLGALAGTTQNPTKPVPLPTALARFVVAKQLKFGGMERLAWNVIRVVYGRNAAFYFVDAEVPGPRELYLNADALDDALYDAACALINQHVETYGVG